MVRKKLGGKSPLPLMCVISTYDIHTHDKDKFYRILEYLDVLTRKTNDDEKREVPTCIIHWYEEDISPYKKCGPNNRKYPFCTRLEFSYIALGADDTSPPKKFQDHYGINEARWTFDLVDMKEPIHVKEPMFVNGRWIIESIYGEKIV